VGYVLATGDRNPGDSAVFHLVLIVGQSAMLLGVSAWLLGAFRAADWRAAVGLRPVGLAGFGLALVAGFVLVGVAFLTTLAIRDVSVSPLGRLLQHVPPRFAFGIGAVLAPVGEELFFRGVVVRAFGRQSPTIGVLAATVLFTYAHVDQLTGIAVALVPIASVALVTGWLRVRSGGVTQPWIVHTTYNVALSAELFLGG
jgi:membrane protease YdiL (CAAX protease family)